MAFDPLPLVSAVASGSTVFLLDQWRRHRRSNIDEAVERARMRNHQTREEARWVDEEQRWNLVADNEGRLSERLARLEEAVSIFRARFEEQGGRRR